MLKTALELLEINYVQLSTQDLKPSANNNTHCSLAKTITRWIKFTKRVELWIHFLQLDDFFEPLDRMNSLYGKRWVKSFLSPHTTSYRKQRAITWEFCRGLPLSLMFSGLLQKGLFKERCSLVKCFFKQNYCHACHTIFAVFFPLRSCCVSSLLRWSQHMDKWSGVVSCCTDPPWPWQTYRVCLHGGGGPQIGAR